jgi:DNA-binding GntR family transcriptional regulator
MPLATLSRPSLRSRVGDRIRDAILSGALPVGRSVNEVALAADLGVSRTPLREALIALTHEGFLRSETGRGFFVAPLTRAEAGEIYPMIWALEALGLEQAHPLPATRLDELDALNEELEAADLATERVLEMDRRWHQALLADCGNARLIRTLDALKAQAFRYEFAYFRVSGQVVASAGQHRRIVTALRGGDLAAARQTLELNWRQTLEFLIPWLGAVTEEG